MAMESVGWAKRFAAFSLSAFCSDSSSELAAIVILCLLGLNASMLFIENSHEAFTAMLILMD